jgi:hypothetical protein
MMFGTEDSDGLRNKRTADSITVAGPAGLSRGDLMYKWEHLPTMKSKGDTAECLLCHTHIRRTHRFKRYREKSRVYCTHESCFHTYYDIINQKVA